MLAHIPPSICNYRVTREIIDDTWVFLRERGSNEVEGIVLWLGTVVDAEHAVVLAAIPPHQIAYRSVHGLSVEIPQESLTELIGALPDGVHILVRVHSHPQRAYHSDLDDTNMVISHEGAISIVVPDFAAGAASIEVCSVNELLADGTWCELADRAVAELFTIV